MNRETKASIVILIICFGLALFVYFNQPQTRNARLVLENPITKFTPSESTYSNKTMHFTPADPYDGYSHWTYSYGGGSQAPTDGFYAMDCDSGEYQYFGYDEFVNHTVITAQVQFRAVGYSGTYFFQPLVYFYQKTALESNTHWALGFNWSSSGIDFIYNTGNGNTPNSVNLAATAINDDFYEFTIQNFGEVTTIYIYDITSTTVIYNGSIETGTYDATMLYAGFGEYCTTGANTWGRWDDFTISDLLLDIPEDGTGISLIDAYFDDTLTHTFYDLDSGLNSTVDVSVSVTNITLLVECWLNGTAYDVSTIAEGKNIIRHNVTVISTNGTVVFSQSNFTYLGGIDYGDNLFLYQYSVQLDFTPTYGNIYTAVVTYEVYY